MLRGETRRSKDSAEGGGRNMGGGGRGGIDQEIVRGEKMRKSKETWWRYRDV